LDNGLERIFKARQTKIVFQLIENAATKKKKKRNNKKTIPVINQKPFKKQT